MFKIAKNKPKHICCAYRCKAPSHTKDRFCPKHSKRYQKETNIIGYVYGALKSNARRRRKPFTLTREEFAAFCEQTDYIKKRGKTGRSACIDRIDNTKGYEAGNIRILTLSANSIKRNTEDYPF